MFKKIMTPVDLSHADRLGRALDVTADMAKTHGAEVVYVGIAAAAPSAVAHTPEEYAEKLGAFAAAQSAKHGHTASAHAITSHDPSVDLNRTLEATVRDLGVDLVVMATHLPNVTDYIWSGHGAHVAAHSEASVFLVRDS